MLNETGILKDRIFQPDIGLLIAKKELGPKSVWLPVVDGALKTCNNYGKIQYSSTWSEKKKLPKL